jgi:hypothetical protein
VLHKVELKESLQRFQGPSLSVPCPAGSVSIDREGCRHRSLQSFKGFFSLCRKSGISTTVGFPRAQIGCGTDWLAGSSRAMYTHARVRTHTHTRAHTRAHTHKYTNGRRIEDEMSYWMGPTAYKLLRLFLNLVLSIHLFSCAYWRTKVRAKSWA